MRSAPFSRTNLKVVCMVIVVGIIALPAGMVVGGTPSSPGQPTITDPMHDTPPTPLTYKPGEIVIKFEQTNFAPGDSLYTLTGATLLNQLPLSGVYLYSVDPDESMADQCDEMQSIPFVEYAHPNYLLNRSHSVQGSYPFPDIEGIGSYDDQLAAEMLDLATAHTVATGDQTTVAVIDGGIDYAHPALGGQAVSGYDYVDDDTDAFDEPGGASSGHGTFVAGVVHLVAPDAAIRAYRVSDPDGYGDGFALAEAIEQAVIDNCDVINLSVVLLHEHNAVRDAIATAVAEGVTVTAAAGNESSGTPIYPAAYDNTIAVAALDSNQIAADFTSYGDHIDVCAPGTQIYSTYSDDIYAWWSGTSFAAPFVAGQVALLREVLPAAAPALTHYAVCQTADNVDSQNPGLLGLLGSGMVNPLASLDTMSSLATAEVFPDSISFTYIEGSWILVVPTATVWLQSSNAPAAYTAQVIDTDLVFVWVQDSIGLTNDSILIYLTDYGSLPVGTYQNEVWFTVEGALEPAVLTVNLTVEPPDTTQTASVSPSSLWFTASAYSDTVFTGSAFLSSSNAPAGYTAQRFPLGLSFTTLIDSVGETNDTVRVEVRPSWAPGPGLHVDTVAYYVDGVPEPAFLTVYLELTDTVSVDTAFVIPQFVSIDLPFGSTDTVMRAVMVGSSNAPAEYTATVLGGPTSFVSLPDTIGMTNDSSIIEVNASGLDVGVYYDTVAYFVSGVSDPALLHVTLNVTDSSGPTASVWPSSFHFTAPEGSGWSFWDTIYVTTTNGPHSYFAFVLDSPSFTTLYDSAGYTDDTIVFEAASGGLAAGLYVDTIIVDIDTVPGSPFLSIVYLTIEADTGGTGSDSAFAYPGFLEFNIPFGSTDTMAANIVIGSSNAPADYTAVVHGFPSFLTVPDPTGQTYDSVLVLASASGYDIGTYYDTVAFGVSGVEESVFVHVTLNVTDSGGTGPGYDSAFVWPPSFSFTAPEGIDTTFWGNLLVTSTNAPALYLAGILDPPDVTLLLDTAGFTDDSIFFQVHSTPVLAAGLYIDTIVVDVDSTINSPRISVVYLTVVADTGGTGGQDSAFVTPEFLTFNVPFGITDSVAQTVFISSTNAPANYSSFVLGGPTSFVALPDSAGFTDDSVPIFVVPTGLSIGTYYDTVVFDVSGVDYSLLVTVTLNVTGADSTAPYTLNNYPNPFNPSTNIVFSLPRSTHVTLEVYNVLGQRVATLADKDMTAGSYNIEWSGVDSQGRPVASGVYFYRLHTETTTLTKKMLLTR